MRSFGHAASKRAEVFRGYGALRRIIAFAVCAGGFQCACASTSAQNEQGLENVVNRAQFDLDCPRHRLRLAPLQYEGDLVTSYGVIGCGRRGAYVRVPRGNLFVLDQNNQHWSPPGGVRAPAGAPKSATPTN
jgi:hypothetical protein